MNLQKIYAFTLVVWLFVQTTAFAAPTRDEKRGGLSPELKLNALKLLTEVGRETSQYKLPENRVRAQTIVAALLWKHDQKEARTLYQNALIELKNLFAEINQTDIEKMSSAQKTAHYFKRHRLAEIRREYLLALAPHDSQAALAALAALKTKKTEGYDPLNAADLEIQVAAAVAENDSDRAYALAKDQLDARGITLEFIESFKDLHKRDSTLAAKLGRDVFAKIKSSKIRPPSIESETSNDESADATRPKSVEIEYWQITYFINAASAMNRRAERDKEKKSLPVFGETEMKELVETAARVYLSARNPAQFSIAQIMPEIARYAPAQAQLVRQKVGAKIAVELDRAAESSEYFINFEDKTADEIAQVADRTEPGQRDQRYADAVRKAIEENEPEKAQKFAARIKDRENYSHVLEQIETALPLAKARRGDLEAVRKMLAGLRTRYERVAALTELASALAAKGEKETANKLLDESLQTLMSEPFKNQTDLEAIGKIASAYSLAEPERSFTIIEEGIPLMSKYINAGILLDEFYDTGSIESDELFYESVNRQIVRHFPDSVNLLKNLAHVDFERAVRMADKFTRPEIRLLVRLRIAQALLDNNAAEKDKKLRQNINSDDEYH